MERNSPGLHFSQIRKVECNALVIHTHTFGANVTGIRKTANGDLLMKLSKTSDEKSLSYQSSVQRVLGEDADIKVLTHTKLIEIKDLDEITTREEV